MTRAPSVPSEAFIPPGPRTEPPDARPFLRSIGLHKMFGRVAAVDDVSFDVDRGEFITLLGPSGCGKSTTLRLIAGLERPDSGEVHVAGRVLSDARRGRFVAPEKRGMGMVFQSYAVWPHMTVFENVAFPLRVRHCPSTEVQRRVTDVLDTIGLAAMADRPATLLSGGQQQRVALGRALVSDPTVLLLDEPFSNLDARLREGMRLELGHLQRRLGVTTIFVTHDQTEAMMLSDRVFVMNAGHVEQVGTPREVYERPASRFVMDFLGGINTLPGVCLRADDGSSRVRLPDGSSLEAVMPPGVEHGGAVAVAFRSADVALSVADRNSDANTGWPATVAAVAYMGGREEYLLQLADGSEIKAERTTENVTPGTPVRASVPADRLRVWPAGAL